MMNIPSVLKLIIAVFFLSILPTQAHALTPAQVFNKVKDSVVVVKNLDAQGKVKGQGSGVLLPSGKIATNYHVVEGAASYQVGRGEQFVCATLYAKDDDKDICLLDAKGISGKPVQLGKAGGLRVGDPVYAVGAPRGLELSLSDGIVSQLRGGPPPFIQTTAAISPGSSGGGLFDGEGRLVGLTTLYIEGGQSLNFAMPVEWIVDVKPDRKLVPRDLSRKTTVWNAQTSTSPFLGATFSLIPAGTFMMGSPLNEPGREDDETQHQVTISRPFYMQTTEVTQRQWQLVMGNNPAYFKGCGDDCPVESVSWNDVREFIRRLNALEGADKYRLPTEAEWEYAARAGTTTALYNGPIEIMGVYNAPVLDSIAWYGGNSCVEYAGGQNSSHWIEKQYPCPQSGTRPVRQKKPNGWGLYDMLGNVWEWVQDRMGDYPTRSVTDPMGPSSGLVRVLRGGGWTNGGASCCRSASRWHDTADSDFNTWGFRLARTE